MTGDPPPLEYQSAGTRDPVRPAWVFAGVATALAAGPGVAFLGLGLGTILESGQYAGLGGLMIGTALLHITGHLAVSSGNRRARQHPCWTALEH